MVRFQTSPVKAVFGGEAGSDIFGAMSEAGFIFVGNLPWLDFVNTEPVREGARVDLLGGPEGLLRWLEAAGLLSAGETRSVSRRWGRSREGQKVYREAAALRPRCGPAPSDWLMDACPRRRRCGRSTRSSPRGRRCLAWCGTDEGFASRLEPVGRSPLHLLVPIAESAAALLERGDASLVRRCEGSQCVLFFYRYDSQPEPAVVQHGGMRSEGESGGVLPKNKTVRMTLALTAPGQYASGHRPPGGSHLPPVKRRPGRWSGPRLLLVRRWTSIV